MNKLYPSVVLGLGSAGADIGTQVEALLAASDHLGLLSLTRTLTLTGAGLLSAGASEATAPLHEEIAGLAGEPAPGVWAENYAAVLGASRLVRQRIEAAVHQVRSFTQAVGFERRDFEVGEDVTFYIVSSLSDPVGSASLVPVLACVGEAFDLTFAGMQPRIQVILLAQDLLPEGAGASPLLKARAFATLQELELALDGSIHIPRKLSVDLAWLLSARNEENLFLGGYEQLVPVIAHQMLSMLRGEVLQDQSLRVAFHQRVEGSAARYSAFGFSRLELPRQKLLAAAAEAVVAEAVSTLPSLEETSLEAASVYGQVEAFVRDLELDRLPTLLETDATGAQLFQPFAPPPAVTASEDAETVLHALAAYEEEYGRTRIAEMQRKMGDRRAQLMAVQKTAFARHVGGVVDAQEPASLAAAEAWLSAMVERPCEWILGAVGTEPMTLRAIDETVQRRLDPQFWPLLYEAGDPEADAYVAAHRSAAGGPRRLLRALELELGEKLRLLEEAKDARARQEAAAEAAEETPDAPAEEVPEMSAAGRAALRRDEILRSARDETEQAQIEGLEGAVSTLKPLYGRILSRVARLDRAVNDASERGRLFRLIVDGSREAVAKAEEAFREGARAHRAKRAETAEWADRRRRWVAVAAAWCVVALAAAGYLAYRYEPLRRLPGYAYGLLLLVAACGVGFRYWTQVGRRYRELQEETARAARQRDVLRDALVGAYRELHRLEFDNHRFDALVAWRDELVAFVDGRRAAVRDLREALRDLAARARAASERLGLDDSPFLVQLLPAGGAAGLVRAREDEIRLQLADMWRETPLSAVLESTLDAPVAEVVGALGARIAERADRVLRDVASLSAEEFILQAYPDPAERRRFLARLYRVAAPFAKRMTEEGGDTTERLAYVGINEAPELSVARNDLEMAERTRFYQNHSDTEVSILRLALAFPAFQFAPMEEAYSQLQALDPAVRQRMYVEPAWLSELRDLKPSRFRLGGPDDESRRLARLALAYGLAEQQDGTEAAEGPVRYHEAQFAGFEAWVLHLRQLAGARDRARLRGEIAELRDRSTAELPPLAEILRAYHAANPALDAVDREILELEMDEVT